ncbi:hypothetical protein [Aquirufa salirivi]|uniref:DUF559 domain-containing protein n=1 Tax=Aquirufa salirivi TaxID=3104729 RepID=A0ABW8RS64_9BACT
MDFSQNQKEKKTIYSPPYDSPIEDELIWHLTKYINPVIEVVPQFEIVTTRANYRLDFALEIEGKLIGIECDGKDYHNLRRDIWRDVEIINNSQIEEIFRFRGCDIYYHINECLYVLGWLHKGLFDNRGFDNLKRLVEGEVFQDSFLEEIYGLTYIDLDFKGFNGEFNLIKVVKSSRKFSQFNYYSNVLLDNPLSSIDFIFEKYNT